MLYTLWSIVTNTRHLKKAVIGGGFVIISWVGFMFQFRKTEQQVFGRFFILCTLHRTDEFQIGRNSLLQLLTFSELLFIHTFFYKNLVYKNLEAQISEILRIFKNHTEARSLDYSGVTASTKWRTIQLKLLFKNYVRLYKAQSVKILRITTMLR